ncbi:hypothetical protein INT47_011263 [Mucor saturninus]|uniref:Uncharacterized protein n=1 Tax=Mucor saturninus TaxID=64648 RepID=A0A8H7VFZ7_9FUNG|nr:hypothetical protein INT47_011263 [Mucor saturninus]
MYAIKVIDSKIIVALDLFSAQYPSVPAFDDYYLAKSIKSIYFTIPVYPKRSFIHKSCNRIDDATNCYTEPITKEELILIKKRFEIELRSLSECSAGKSSTTFLITTGLDVSYYEDFYYNLVVNLIEWIQVFDTKKLNNTLMTFGKCLASSILITRQDTMEGTKAQIRQKVQISNTRRPPSIILKDAKVGCCGASAVFPLKVSKPKYIIYIDISSTAVKLAWALVGNNNSVENFTEFKEWPVLKLTTSLKIFMEENFEDILNIALGHNEKPIKNKYNVYAMKKGQDVDQFKKRIKPYIYMKNKFSVIASVFWDPRNRRIKEKYLSAVRNAGLKVNGYLVRSKLNRHFAKLSKESKLSVADKSHIFTCQAKYIRLFLMMYVGYVKKLVNLKLNTIFRNDCNSENTAYIATLDKAWMNSNLILNNNPKELLIESGILPEFGDNKMARFVVRGEGILPAIQQKLCLELCLQSYFVVAQIHPTHLQVTLHQVVKISSSKGNESTIIIKDKKFEMRNIIDLISINIWKHMKACGKIEHSNSDTDKRCLSSDLNSLQIYNDVLKSLKLYVSECFKPRQAILNMDKIQQIKLSHTCDCTFDLSLRTTIEVGLKPVVEGITDTIAASLTNDDLFGNYVVDFLFILTELFPFVYDCPNYTAFTRILKEAMDSSIQSKEKDTPVYVLEESLCQLIQPAIDKQPFMYDSFITVRLTHSVTTKLEGIISSNDFSYDMLSTFEFGYDRNYDAPLHLEIKPINHSTSLQFTLRFTGEHDEEKETAPDTILEQHLTLSYC